MARKTTSKGADQASNDTLTGTDPVDDAVVAPVDAEPDASADASTAPPHADDVRRETDAPSDAAERAGAGRPRPEDDIPASDGAAEDDAVVLSEGATMEVRAGDEVDGSLDALATGEVEGDETSTDPAAGPGDGAIDRSATGEGADRPFGPGPVIDPTPGDSPPGGDPSADPSVLSDAPTDRNADMPPAAIAPPARRDGPDRDGSDGDRRGPGFVPLLLGGLVAGAIGYAVPTFLLEDGRGGNDDRIAGLESELATLRSGDGAAVVAEQLDALDARVTALEAPPEDPVDQAAAASTAALEEDEDAPGLPPEIESLPAALSELTDRVAALSGRLDEVPQEPDLGDLPDRVAAIEAEIGTLQSDVDDAAATARADAQDRLRLAVESGQPYAAELAELPDAPDALAANAETGIPRADALAADFPPLARASLRAARADETLDGGGIASLAGRFLNARSLEAREGDDPDAILSRAEAALRQGDVPAALDEIGALPEEARAPLGDWIVRARARVETRSALNDYLQDG